jgi:hypothetical protein
MTISRKCRRFRDAFAGQRREFARQPVSLPRFDIERHFFFLVSN